MSIDVTVVIPAYNAAGYIEQCLAGAVNQTLPPDCGAYEVLLIDDGSTDNTHALAEALRSRGGHARLKILSRPNGGPAAARNTGIRNAQGGIIVFLDSDCVPEPGWLASITRPLLDNPNLEGAEGQTLPEHENNLSPLDHYIDNRTGGYYWTCNMAYRTETLRKIGGFDEGFPWPSGEDIDIAHRVKQAGELVFVPEAVVRHLILKWPVSKHVSMARTFPSMIRLWRKHDGLLIPEGSGFWRLVRFQLAVFARNLYRDLRWLIKDPVTGIKLEYIHLMLILKTLVYLPRFYREAHASLEIREPFLDDTAGAERAAS